MKITSDDNRATAPGTHGNGQPHLGLEERTLLRCCFEALELEEAGHYESARHALSEWWPPVSASPHTDGLDPRAAAVLLLRAGALTGCLVSAKLSQGAQADAKKLVRKSIRLFEQAGQRIKAAEARAELGWCHWREGDFKGARQLLRQALAEMGDGEDSLRAKAIALMHAAVVEFELRHLADALDLLREAAPFFYSCDSHALRGMFHNNLGIVFKEMGEESDREDFLDRAVIEHTEAAYHFEKAKAERLQAQSENNLGFVLFLLGEFDEAAKHLDRAFELFTKLDDDGHAAQVNDTHAKLLLAERRYEEAARVAAKAVRVLEASERKAVLAEALTTWGVALARTGRFPESREKLALAGEVAEEAGAWETAGLAALSALEELREEQFDFVEARKLYEHACSLLAKVHHARTRQRLTKASCRLLATTHAWDSSAGIAAAEASPLRAAALRLCGSNSPVLITGKNAEARRLLARLAHELSGRTGRFVAVDCKALEDGSASREFLDRDTWGVAGGTLFLDKVQELCRQNQGRLLRLAKYGVIEHGQATLRRERIDVRVVAGTSCDLSAEVEGGYFSPELFDRLSGSAPLNALSAEALEELRVLAGCLFKEEGERCGLEGTKRPEVARMLRMPAAQAPGALVRQLARISTMTGFQDGYVPNRGGGLATALALDSLLLRASDDEGHVTLDDCVRHVEINLIREALEAADGQLNEAAHILGITRQRLAYTIETKYPELQGSRTPIVRRRRRTAAAGMYDEAPA